MYFQRIVQVKLCQQFTIHVNDLFFFFLNLRVDQKKWNLFQMEYCSKVSKLSDSFAQSIKWNMKYFEISLVVVKKSEENHWQTIDNFWAKNSIWIFIVCAQCVFKSEIMRGREKKMPENTRNETINRLNLRARKKNNHLRASNDRLFHSRSVLLNSDQGCFTALLVMLFIRGCYCLIVIGVCMAGTWLCSVCVLFARIDHTIHRIKGYFLEPLINMNITW